MKNLAGPVGSKLDEIDAECMAPPNTSRYLAKINLCPQACTIRSFTEIGSGRDSVAASFLVLI
jgi:hypothetical protein